MNAAFNGAPVLAALSHYVLDMNKVSRFAAMSLGSVCVLHYAAAPYFSGEGPEAPPTASIVMPSTAVAATAAPHSVIMFSVLDTITDAEYDAVLPTMLGKLNWLP